MILFEVLKSLLTIKLNRMAFTKIVVPGQDVVIEDEITGTGSVLFVCKL